MNISLIVQAIAAFLVFFFASIGITIFVNRDVDKKLSCFKFYVGVISLVLAIGLAIFYVCNAIFVQEYTVFQIGLFVFAIMCYLFMISFGIENNDLKYDKAFIPLVPLAFCIFIAYLMMS